MSIKMATICDFSDLLYHAEKLGYSWNKAHDLLVDADIFVGYLSKDHYADGAYCESNEHVEARAILKSFMEKHGLKEFYITPKGYDF